GLPPVVPVQQVERLRALQCVQALAIVDGDETVQPLITALLGHTWVALDLAGATAAWREVDGEFDFVTRRGELLNRHGIYTGGYLNGSGDGKAPSSILGRKNQ